MYTLPLCQSIYCYLSLQIQVYSEFGENPPAHAWDQNKRGTIDYRVDHDNDLHWDEVMTFMKYYSHTFIKLSWAEYVFISTFLARIFWSANWTNTMSAASWYIKKRLLKKNSTIGPAQTSLIVVLLTTAGMMMRM